MSAYAELAVTTNYSFLRGASHPFELVQRAAELGHTAIGIADRNTLAGVVRAYAALKEMPVPKPRLLVGARLVFRDGAPDILAYPQDRAAYGRLCRLLSAGKMRAPKGECYLTFEDLLKWQEGLLLIVLPLHPLRQQTEEIPNVKPWNEKHSDWQAVPEARPATDENVVAVLNILSDAAPERVWLGLAMPYLGDDLRRLHRWKSVAQSIGVPLIATNDVHYHMPERRMLQDVVTCIRKHVTLDAAGHLLDINAERHLKSAEEMQVLFAEIPEAVTETQRFADRIRFKLDQIKYNYPEEPVSKGKTPQRHLEDLVLQGALERYNHVVPEKVQAGIDKELTLIAKMGIAEYFLTVHDIVKYARSKGILCQGRGSAANSTVCYVLGITAVDPTAIDLLFERFISEERKEPPDIDVDFEHERREEVIQYVYERYGRHRAALTATVICYRPRSAIGEVGKVFGLTEDVTARMAGSVWGSWGSALKEREVRQGALDPQNAVIVQVLIFANELIGFPRHLSQHVGGFVLTQDRLDECVPIGPATMEDRFFIEWDKDDIDALRMMKVDVLALGMLTCIRKAFDLMRKHEGEDLDLAKVPTGKKDVYEMLQKADAIGVFQVESRAQMSMLPRLKPENFYDLVVEVAIVRPGPIQGNMVHPYLKSRKQQKDPNNKEPIHFPGSIAKPDELRDVLGKTYGVPLFQEQAMKLAIVAANFSADEANGLRRAMATFRNVGTIGKFKDMFIGRMIDRGYEPDFAARCFKQIEGFGSYGFPESHAASFALLVYISAYIKKRHPASFAAALLNSQPMGFYAPAEIVRDAREHDVEVRQVDVNYSDWDNTLEDGFNGLALRLGFRQVDGFHEDWAKSLVAARGNRYGAVADVAKRAKLPKRALIILAEADSFQSIDKDRREILWAVRRLPDDDDLPLFAASYTEEQPEEVIAPLPVMPMSEQVVADYQMLRLSLKAHLMFFLRDFFGAEGVSSCAEINEMKDGARASCAGIVLIRQMPGDSGVVFVTLSDEQSVVNAVVWPRLVSVFRREIMGARLMVVEGKVQRSEEGVVHLVAARIFDRSEELNRLSEDQQDAPSWRAQASSLHRHPRNVRTVPKSRDFH